MYSGNDFRNYSELRHHGIMGQKWGVRNGPPYPLAEERHNKSEQKARWKSSLTKAKENKGINTKSKGDAEYEVLRDERQNSNHTGGKSLMTNRLDEKFYEATKLTSRYGETIFPPIGRVFDDAIRIKKSYLENIKEAISDRYGDENYRPDPDNQRQVNSFNKFLKEKEDYYKPDDSDQAMIDFVDKHTKAKGFEGVFDKVNPGYKEGEPGTDRNCPFVGLAVELQGRGLDVIARRSFGGAAATIFEKFFKGAKTEYCKDWSEMKADILKDGDGASGVLQGYYGKGLGDGKGGHTLHWHVDGSDIKMIDGQNHTEFSFDEMIDRYGFGSNGCIRTRLDNCEPDWSGIERFGAIGVSDENRYWSMDDYFSGTNNFDELYEKIRG